jgi:hypothetical protein
MSESHPPTPVSPISAITVRSDDGSYDGSYLEWSAVFGGAFVAAALSFLLLTFGSAVGLSVVSPWSNPGTVAITLGLVTAIWFILVVIASFIAGGYLAGRMRAKGGDATEHEVEVRDGIHGILVWAVAVVMGVLLSALTAASIARSGAEIGATVAPSAATAASAAMPQASDMANPMGYYVDKLYRSEGQPAGSPLDMRTEVARILMAGAASGEVPPADRTYIAQAVAAQTGLDPEVAKKRVTTVLAEAEKAAAAAEAAARQAANIARKVAAVAGFLAAATLLISAAAAWWAAGLGGQHREAGTFPLLRVGAKAPWRSPHPS